MTWDKQDSQSNTGLNALGVLVERIIRLLILEKLAVGDSKFREYGIDAKLTETYAKSIPKRTMPTRTIKKSYLDIQGNTWT